MSLFSIVFRSQDGDRISLSPSEAFAAIGVAAIAADGYLSGVERQRIVDLLLVQPLFAEYSEQRLREMLEDLFNLLSTRGLEPLVAIARESLPSDYQESAFRVATDLVLVDGPPLIQEKEFLRHLWKIMDIPIELVTELLDSEVAEYSLRETP